MDVVIKIDVRRTAGVPQGSAAVACEIAKRLNGLYEEEYLVWAPYCNGMASYRIQSAVPVDAGHATTPADEE